jgi:hypothetical protein
MTPALWISVIFVGLMLAVWLATYNPTKIIAAPTHKTRVRYVVDGDSCILLAASNRSGCGVWMRQSATKEVFRRQRIICFQLPKVRKSYATRSIRAFCYTVLLR